MERYVTIRLDVDDRIDGQEIMYAVQKAVNEVEGFEGFHEAEVASVSGMEQNKSVDKMNEKEIEALLKFLNAIDADEYNVGEKLEKAQEMAWRMVKDDVIMEVEEDAEE